MATAGPALVFEAAEQGSVVMAQLTGVINEDNSLHERLTATRGKGVLIDLGNVERINSCGVRDWVRFAQRLEAAGNALFLLRCSPVVVAQINMVRNFCGDKGQVVSFQAPYICPNCDEERTETFPAAKVSQGKSPEATCTNCGSQMEFDDLPDLYFAFAKIHGPKVVPAEIQSAMEVFKSGAPVGTRIHGGGTPMPATPAPGAARPGMPAVPTAKPIAAAPAAQPPRPPPTPAATAAPARPSNPALRPPAAAAPSAPAAAPARPSNPALQPPPAATVASAAAARPSNPALRSPTPPAPSAASATSASAAASVRRPSSPGLAPVHAASGSLPTPMPSEPGARASGPKPARPLMGGSPFPTRSSGLKQGMAAPPPMTPPGDPTKK